MTCKEILFHSQIYTLFTGGWTQQCGDKLTAINSICYLSFVCYYSFLKHLLPWSVADPRFSVGGVRRPPTGVDPGFDQGGPDRDRPKLPMVRTVVRAKRTLFSLGSGANLRALEALGYFITKYAFSPFWGTFLYYF